MRRLYRFLTGSYRITFSSTNPERVLNVTLKQNIPIWNIEKGEKAVSFSISPSLKSVLLANLALSGSEQIKEEKRGVLVILQRFGKRWGLMLGFALFLVVILLSTCFVWSVEVEGNSVIPEEEIRERVARLGLSPGTVISKIDTGDFSLLFQVENPEFSYASLNIIGTRAILSVRERESLGEEREEENGASNLVSSIHGEILRFEVLSGQIAVKRGDVVPKGALLISGVVEKSNGAFATVKAQGRVFAKTERFFQVHIPLKEKQTVFTGKEEQKRKYRILGFSFALPGFEDCDYSQFKALESTEPMVLFGRELPILVTTRTLCETEEKTEVLTVDRAKKKAYDSYEEYKRDHLAPGYEILEENISFTEEETGVWLSVELVLSENIALSSPFSCVELPN